MAVKNDLSAYRYDGQEPISNIKVLHDGLSRQQEQVFLHSSGNTSAPDQIIEPILALAHLAAQQTLQHTAQERWFGGAGQASEMDAFLEQKPQDRLKNAAASNAASPVAEYLFQTAQDMLTRPPANMVEVVSGALATKAYIEAVLPELILIKIKAQCKP